MTTTLQRTAIGMGIMMVLLLSCKKKQYPFYPGTDPRDEVAGTYEVWDSLFLPNGKDSMGNTQLYLEGVFHYPQVDFSKGRVLVRTLIGDDYYENGLLMYPRLIDTNYTSPKGYKAGLFVNGKEFTFTGGYTNTLGNPDQTAIFGISNYSGKSEGNWVYLSASNMADTSYSKAYCLRIK